MLLAIYAAALSTILAAWQIYSARTRVRVRLDLNQEHVDLAGRRSGPVAVFTVTNHSDHDVTITHLGLWPAWWRRRRGARSIMIAAPLGLPTPGAFTVPAHDSATPYVPRDALEGSALSGQRVRGAVRTSTGKSFWTWRRVKLP